MSDLYPSEMIKYCPFCKRKTKHIGNGDHRCTSCKKEFKVARVMDTWTRNSQTNSYSVITTFHKPIT